MGLLSRRLLDTVVVVMALFMILLLGYTSSQVITAAKHQAALLEVQNRLLICNAHDTTLATKKIGTRLGLNVSDIVVPKVGGLGCEELLRSSLDLPLSSG